MSEIFMTVLVFNSLIMVLLALILAARALLVGHGRATIAIEGYASVQTGVGIKLHMALIDAGIPVPASCGGRGTCGLCRVRVGGELDAPLPTEVALLGDHELARGMRLACQVTVRGDLEVATSGGLPVAGTIEARVRASRFLTPLIKEIVLDLPEEAPFAFRAGSFVQVTCPPLRIRLGELPVDDEAVRAEWGQLVGSLEASSTGSVTRAYSIANHPGEGRIVMLVVRLALPPPGAPAGAPPGVCSSYLFSLRPGDPVAMTGPFGHFAATDTAREMVFVGGGAGMAPMRAHVFEQLEVLRTERKISFWYGARSRRDILYADDFERLHQEHPNFTWSVALSEPAPDDDWPGAVGFIHQHLHDAYLATHPSPADCEYYLCGPPLMVRAVVAMLERLGVDRADIFYDDFGE